MIDDVIQKYSKSLGLPPPNWEKEGIIHLQSTELGDLYLERIPSPPEDVLLVYLTREIANADLDTYFQILEFCHYTLPFPVNAGLYGDNKFVFSIKLEGKTLSQKQLETAVNLLIRLQEDLQQTIET
ncbi:MAG: hypothetical protein COZ46_01240 [Verrucomicrobia bacterium CG_4_10_14_3_um_filter_43_23]|nr:MAG: hypothetical protein AUJ82_01275 [Verrucomicrobia bacterium CG1_02_43_26]PIP59528.1 MAG: hypothetical protein COX01_02845 [Verrucomicrobia bacterium CG22_combo_CG10-13_8_21_14_all_43_17]PIX58829.1 MAG: hypothetical protein COZ46_01240 [Verrucomicrobia bacterium CG_4_10_14_3_um_filter_43_23]PIY60924.1 MAG: hypothetical protein COY94_07920 [Verrucomicrobia bacterium CG_4_10_14_0_8_um_filter_43_34]PJA44838.1 MAG: hypothetical protein CO175_00730 [Verrucomicrobia bacterium CG_4_9_14_3_um_fi